MPRSCSICIHDQSSEITRALTAGGSKRDVAARFGVTDASVQRHRTHCLRLTPAKKERPAPIERTEANQPVRFEPGDPAQLVETTARLVNEALDLLEHAKTQKDTRSALSALREARDGLALLMRAAGLLAGDGAVTIVDARRQEVKVAAEALTTDELREYIAWRRGVPMQTAEKLNAT